ncbi:hypothetical protein [Bdellovibrio sp. NC01]|uniref:hypothetical protein n=1 Tax=Bdellovibrio sp. NC01 TaxID=2220073 RepID=UPI0011577D0B|nr:hypothetical protein [Bdellovibrio sp. NC01]QDK38962.1 hypothetical protein DOE51_15895 [Bdellovibrio sp. NC01]
MMKIVFKTLVVMAFTTTAFAQAPRVNENTTAASRPEQNQFSTWVMNGWSTGLEYAGMNGDMKIKVSSGSASATLSSNTNTAAGALGASINYSQLPRSRAGFSVGLGVINKIENDKDETNSLKSSKSFTQIRPEANVGYALNNGLYGMVGAHLSYITGGNMTDAIQAFGGGLQASLGLVATRNLGFDVGYYYSRHGIADKVIDQAKAEGLDVNKDDSYLAFTQLRGRVTYYF